LTITKTNQGFITEETHYQILKDKFDWISDPKGSGGGSDFTVSLKGQIVTFESKTANTDAFDAGVISAYANGQIYNLSSFLTDRHYQQLQQLLNKNKNQFEDYVNIAKVDAFAHSIDRTVFEEIKAEKKLIQIRTDNPLDNILSASFDKSDNQFKKANYMIIGDNIYLPHTSVDPLNLVPRGAAILDGSCIADSWIRSARSGTNKNGRVSVSLRSQFRLFKQLPETKVTIHDL